MEGVEGVEEGVGVGGGGAEAPGMATSSQSCPSSTIKAISWPTFTEASPSPTRILATTPSSSASMATTALSVWMSHSTSPAAIASPSALYHLTMVPSSMVGDRLGMFTATPGVLPPEAAAGGAAAVSLDGGGVAAVTPASATNAINVPTFTVRFSSVISLAMVPSSAASM